MNDKIKKEKYIADRATLIGFFKKGELPSQEHFKQLINSNFNKADDRLDIDDRNGLMIYPTPDGNLISFFEGSDDEHPKYIVFVSKDGISIKELVDTHEHAQSTQPKNAAPQFFIEKGTGNVGIGNGSPEYKLDVEGIVRAQGRLGNIEGEIPADGKWYNVFKQNLEGVHAFEIMAYARGEKGKGRYALLHAIATNTYGKSKARITKTSSYFGGRSNEIAIRWVSRPSRIKKGIVPDEGEASPSADKSTKSLSIFKAVWEWIKELIEEKELEYNLQLKTRTHYQESTGTDKPDDNKLFYKISLLWNPDVIPRN